MDAYSDTRASDGQLKQIIRMAQDAAEAGFRNFFQDTILSKEGAERLKGNPAFAARIRDATTIALKELSAPDKFKDEEVSSTYGYPSSYQPKGLIEQCNSLRELFPGVGYPNQNLLAQIEKGEIPLPDGAEGWFAIPDRINNPNIFGVSYCSALEKVLITIKKARDGKFHIYHLSQLSPEFLRESQRTEHHLAVLSEGQSENGHRPDILIVAAQFGIRHRGRSVRRASEVFVNGEFGLGAFANGIMLLTHPERLQHYDDLWIDCSGDEFSPKADGDFSCAPSFGLGDGELEFDAGCWINEVNDYCGSVSGFAPQ